MAATLDDVVAQLQKLNNKMKKMTAWMRKTYPDDPELNEVDA